MSRNVHLVGSVPLQNAEAVFRALSEHLGERAPQYPDGETGERHYWIRWQQAVFEKHPQLELDTKAKAYREGSPLNVYQPRIGVKPEDVKFGTLGYADAALESWEVFKRLKKEDKLPPPVRFLVALPTPIAVVTSFVTPELRAALEPAYERALLAELKAIASKIPHDQLAIQWDVCHEVCAQDGAIPLQYADVLENTLVRLARLGGALPEAARLGFHLCYGDPGHKHIVEPKDLATAVAFANGIAARVERRVDWIHMPVPRGRKDDAYFAPLAGLRLKAETELVLGLIHYTDGEEGSRERIAAAEKVVKEFGVATECGWGRRDPATIPALLRIHRKLYD